MMASGVDLDALFAVVDDLSARVGGSRGDFLLDHGLALHDTLARSTYRSTPLNSVTFASTGGDGVHFGLLQTDSRPTRNGPVIMTVPMASQPNHVVAGSIGEFLGLGCVHGWLFLEQLAYRPAYTFDLYALATPPTEAPIAQLFDALRLNPVALQVRRLAELSRQHDAAIVLAPAETAANREPVDRDAFLAWKRSKYGGP